MADLSAARPRYVKLVAQCNDGPGTLLGVAVVSWAACIGVVACNAFRLGSCNDAMTNRGAGGAANTESLSIWRLLPDARVPHLNSGNLTTDHTDGTDKKTHHCPRIG